MRLRTFLVAITILGTVWHTAAAQPKKKIEADAPAPETILAGLSTQSNSRCIRSACDQTGNAPGPTRRSQILRNRHEHGG